MKYSDVLAALAGHARERVEAAKQRMPLPDLQHRALAHPSPDFAFERALRNPGVALICECKKASPSKGLIAPDFPYLQIAQDYAEGGADAISVLTEPKWFLGSDSCLEEIARAVPKPVLRKDFTVDPYMIWEARALGASAVLLICALLTEDELRESITLCDELGLSALVEAHDEAEVTTALRAGSRIIGVNNRNLRDFSVDPENSRRLRALVPADVVFISESGITGPDDVRTLTQLSVDGILVGEVLMRTRDRKGMLREMRAATL